MNQPEPQTKIFPALLNSIESGHTKIPQFQREFVWSKQKSAKLLDSILKGYPIGTFIIWRTKDVLRVVRNLGGIELPQTPAGDSVEYILDGQQRLTSLFASVKGLKIKRDERIDDFSQIFVDLEAGDDQEVVIVDTSQRNPEALISVTELMNGGLEHLTSKFPSHLQSLDAYRQRLQSYPFSLVVINEAPIEVATEIFTRLNVNGQALTIFEIMAAKTFDADLHFDLAEEFGELQDDLRHVDYDTVSPTVILQAASAILVGECSRRHILSLNKDEFIAMWPDLVSALKSGVEYFRNNYRIPVSRLLPYASILVPFTYFFYYNPDKPSARAASLLQDFFWRVALTGRYSQALEGRLAQDVKRMDQILQGEQPSYEQPVDTSPEFVMRNGWFSATRSYVKAILCLLAFHEPKSFADNSVVRLSNDWLKRANSKNYHHFFPRAYLAKRGYEEMVVNHIANITIVDDYLNKRQIGAKPPSEYMTVFREENNHLADTMKTHLISIDGSGIWDNNFDLFLKMRCRAIAAELDNRIIPQAVDKQGQQVASDDYEDIELEDVAE